MLYCNLILEVVEINLNRKNFTSRKHYVENNSAANSYYYLDDVNAIENEMKEII
jgi:hypothetical protein